METSAWLRNPELRMKAHHKVIKTLRTSPAIKNSFFVFVLRAFVVNTWIQERDRNTMTLKETIIADMTAAMKAKDAARTSTLRMLKAAITNREKEGAGGVTDEDVMKLLRAQVKQRRDSVEQYQKAGRQDLVDKETAEITVIESYLPQAASEAEIEQAVTDAIGETGATSMKEMGAVMKAAIAKLTGKNADGRIVSETVKKKLAS